MALMKEYSGDQINLRSREDEFWRISDEAQKRREERTERYIKVYELAMEKQDTASALLALRMLDGGQI